MCSFGNEKTVFTYSPYGELVNRAVNNINHSYSYDADSNLISYAMSKDNEQEVSMSYEYDSLNRLKAVISPLGRVRYTYDKADRLIDEENANGVQTSYDFYPSGNIRRITYQNNGTVTDKLYYEYDKAGNRLVEQNDEYIREYTYDGINRLISSDKDREYYTYYEYDGFNNLKTVYELTNGETYKTVYEYDKNNRLVFKSDDFTTSFYEYDNKGNLIKTKETDFDNETESLCFYDGYNRLAEMLKDGNIISYTYDYEGIRNSKTINGIKTAFITDNGNVIAEYTEEKSNRYFRGNSLIGSVNELNEGFYYSRNAHGDIISLLDYKGDSLNDYSYTDWGAIEETENQNFFGGQFKNLWQQETTAKYETPFTYSGEYLDVETGLIYLRNRYYDPNTQRFITEDPAQDGLNWYAYCGNNPVNFVDPWGYYKEGDEKLPDVIQYLINGEDKKTGGLTKMWSSTNNEEEKSRISKLADMLRTYKDNKYDFDYQHIEKVVLLNNEKAVGGAGHNAIMLIDGYSKGMLFSYNPDVTFFLYPGEMRIDILSDIETFYQSGKLYYTLASTGDLVNENYTRGIEMSISNLQGKSMFKKGVEYFWNDGMYVLIGNQCDNVASRIMRAGNAGYLVESTPNKSLEKLSKDFNMKIDYFKY